MESVTAQIFICPPPPVFALPAKDAQDNYSEKDAWSQDDQQAEPAAAYPAEVLFHLPL